MRKIKLCLVFGCVLCFLMYTIDAQGNSANARGRGNGKGNGNGNGNGKGKGDGDDNSNGFTTSFGNGIQVTPAYNNPFGITTQFPNNSGNNGRGNGNNGNGRGNGNGNGNNGNGRGNGNGNGNGNNGNGNSNSFITGNINFNVNGLFGGNRGNNVGTNGNGLGLGLSRRQCTKANIGISIKQAVCEAIGPFKVFNLAQKSGSATTGITNAFGYIFLEEVSAECGGEFHTKYRTFDGTCNNYQHRGSAFKPVARLLRPEYDDGFSAPRTRGVGGFPLPSARAISMIAHPSDPDLTGLTIMVMQWGQWLDHDITGYPVATEEIGPVKCCGVNHSLPPPNTDVHCFPIILPPIENHFAGSCMEFVRSLPVHDQNGNEIRPREQMNSLTSFVDGSQIYGASQGRSDLLRDGCLLRTKYGNFLPESPDEDCMTRRGSRDYCFSAGDIRVNEQPGLASMHTLWLREHNRIASYLRSARRADSDDEIFHLTRKIVGALQQVISYNEWLPIILGQDAYTSGLVSRQGRSLYNPELDPRIINSFSSAAMRFGHSTIPDALPIGNRRVPLRQLFNRPAEVLDNFDDVIAGLAGAGTPGRRNLFDSDRNFVIEITNHLFDPPNQPAGHGLDLVALNIQRGRDHGLPPYVKFREYCGLRAPFGFNDEEVLGPYGVKLGQVYRSVQDIDLFTGMTYEPVERNSEALVGPTFRCLLKKQFFNLKYGDRFFFDTNNRVAGFSDDQIAALRRTRLANVICENTNVDAVPRDVFRFPDGNNPLIPCAALRYEGLDLRPWAY